MHNRFFLLLFLTFSTVLVWGQNELKLTGGHFKLGTAKMVLKDAKFTNNGTFHGSEGKIIVRGTATSAHSGIGGTSIAEVKDLTIDKSSNHTSLKGDVKILNELNLLNGCVEVGDHDLSLDPLAEIVGAGAGRFVKMSGSGSLTRQVDDSSVAFPVGKSSYNPVLLKNNGTTDFFSVGLMDEVLAEGTTGTPITTGTVGRTWLIAEKIAGGSDVDITLQWEVSNEASGFDRMVSYISHFDDNEWDSPATEVANGSDPFTLVRSGVSTFSPFTVASGTALSLGQSGTQAFQINESSSSIQQTQRFGGSMRLKVFPNPIGQGNLNIHFPYRVDSALLSVFAPSGQVVGQRKVSGDFALFDFSNLSKGIYWVHLRDGHQSWRERVAVQ